MIGHSACARAAALVLVLASGLLMVAWFSEVEPNLTQQVQRWPMTLTYLKGTWMKAGSTAIGMKWSKQDSHVSAAGRLALHVDCGHGSDTGDGSILRPFLSSLRRARVPQATPVALVQGRSGGQRRRGAPILKFAEFFFNVGR